jgi:hypothetical protein
MKKKMMGILIVLLCMAQVMPVSAQIRTMPDHAQFDAEYYAANNPDVVRLIGTDEAVLYQHYVTFGCKEGRRPYAPTVCRLSTKQPYIFTMDDGNVFDATYYLAMNPDVYNYGITTVEGAYAHYINNGKAEGRKASANNTIQGGTYANDSDYNKFKFAVLYEMRNQSKVSNFVDAYSYYKVTDKNRMFYTLMLTTLATELTHDFPKDTFTTAMFDAGTDGTQMGITYSRYPSK